MDDRFMNENGYGSDNYSFGSSRLGDFSAYREEQPQNNSFGMPQYATPFNGIPQQVVNPQPIQQPTYQQPKSFSNSGTVIHKPKTYEDVKMLIEHLKMNEQIIVDFSNISSVTVYRVLDFLSGAIFALNGSMQKISDNIILFAPSGVQITIPTNLGNK